MDGALRLEADFTGFGEVHMESLGLLQKALEAGAGVDITGATFAGGRALIPESLETTLVNILHTQDEARVFQALKKVPIKSPIHQWDERTEVGADDGAWVPEGGDSEEADQTIARKYMTSKYLQTLRKVTLQASISNMIEPAMVLEQNAGTLWIIRNAERGIIYGNPDWVSEQPEGLIKQIPTANILDVRGADASSVAFENAFNEGCRQIRDNFGRASNFFGSTKVMEDVQRLLRDRIRFAPGQNQGAAVFTEYPTPFGTPQIKDDIFIKEGAEPKISGLTNKRPDILTIDTQPVAAGSGALVSQFLTGDAGNYYYKFVGVNRYGDGTKTAESSVVAVAADQKVTIEVGPGAIAPTAIKIYRTKKDGASGSKVLYLGTVPVVAATDPTVIVDLNADLPGCSDGFLLTMEQVYDAIEWFQFLPLMKFDLYPTNAAVYPFLMLLFGALALKKPVQHIRIKNIAPSALGWF